MLLTAFTVQHESIRHLIHLQLASEGQHNLRIFRCSSNCQAFENVNLGTPSG